MSIFKACDVRGVYPDEFDEAAAWRIGRALTRIMQEFLGPVPELRERVFAVFGA